MKKEKDLDYNFIAFVVISAWMMAFFAGRVWAKSPTCTVRLDSNSVARVAIGVDGTVLDFPTKPTKVILGRKGSFGVEYVENDLAISPLSSVSKSNLFVYLEGRRFTFDLKTSQSGGVCAVISVRDSEESQMRVKFNGS